MKSVGHSGERDADERSFRPARIARRGLRSAIRWLAGATVVVALVAWGIYGRPAPPVASVAVLPFRPLFGVPHDLPLEIGLADLLSSRLGAIDPLIVAPITSTSRYAESGIEAGRAGRELGVEAVLTGTVHRTGGRVRVTARLERVANGASLWSASFDEPSAELAAIEVRIAVDAAHVLNAAAARAADTRLRTPVAADAEAHRQYLVGRYHWSRGTADGWQRSVEYFDRAVKLDPACALAWASLADAHASLAEDHAVPREALAKARTAAQQALELDAGVTGARQAFARVTAYLEHDWRIAADELRRAMALRPSMGSIHTELGLVLSALGRGAEAITETTRGLELDPFSERARGAAGLALVGARRYEDAAALAGRVLARDDRSAAAHYIVGLAHHGAGRTADAVAALQRARQLDAASLAIESSLAAALAASGDRASASASLADLVRRAKGAEISPYYIALIEAALGQPDAALRRLEEADRERSPRVRELRVHPVWIALQGDRRFVQLLARLGM